MEVKQAIKERRSIRRFTEEKLTEAEFAEIVDLARFAPSWKNSQTVRYHVLSDRKQISSIGNDGVLDFSYNTKTILKAPHIVVVTNVVNVSGTGEDGAYATKKEGSWEMFDAGIATQTFCLAAHALGFGTVVMGIYDEDKVAEIIELPDNERVAALVAIGHPKFVPDKVPPRLDVDELLTFE